MCDATVPARCYVLLRVTIVVARPIPVVVVDKIPDGCTHTATRVRFEPAEQHLELLDAKHELHSVGNTRVKAIDFSAGRFVVFEDPREVLLERVHLFNGQ